MVDFKLRNDCVMYILKFISTHIRTHIYVFRLITLWPYKNALMTEVGLSCVKRDSGVKPRVFAAYYATIGVTALGKPTQRAIAVWL